MEYRKIAITEFCLTSTKINEIETAVVKADAVDSFTACVSDQNAAYNVLARCFLRVLKSNASAEACRSLYQSDCSTNAQRLHCHARIFAS